MITRRKGEKGLKLIVTVKVTVKYINTKKREKLRITKAKYYLVT